MRKILIVEDGQDLQRLLQTILENSGYDVCSETNGCAIVNNRYEIPDLFIIDKVINVIDGIALCKFLKLNKQTRHIPVILISADAEVAEKAQQIGADYFMRKPVAAYELVTVIESLASDKERVVR